ncbi:hypothetical protein DXG01_010767 [Tephrocybe rancida]|nr:hypothetical protein DXG01_010767 [Tephrocybe rancida]
MYSRSEAMDAQRFDPAKSFRAGIDQNSSLVSSQEEIQEPRGPISFLEFFSSPSTGSSITESASSTSLKHHEVALFQPNQALDRFAILDAQRYDISKSRHKHTLSASDVSASTTCSSPAPDSDAEHSSNESEPTSEEVDDASSFTASSEILHDDISCTIVAPLPRSPILGIFSRPSSPVSMMSRPGSSISLSSLNCFGTDDNFEEDFQIFQAQRATKADFRILVTQAREIHREEAWRTPLQDLLYGPELSGGQNCVVVCRD